MSTTTHGKNVIDLTDQNFEREALQSPLPTLVDFGAAWCGPCRAIAPHLDALADTYAGRVRVGTLDVDANQRVAGAYEIKNLPTLLLFKDGRVVGQHVGAAPRAKLEEFLKRALV